MRYLWFTANSPRNPEEFVRKFKHNATDEIRAIFPRLFLGRDADGSKGGFTVILLRDEGESPKEQAFLSLMKLTFVDDGDYAMFQSWAVDPDRSIDFTRLARFFEVSSLPLDDPFAPAEAPVLTSTSTVKHDHLFDWLCASGKGSYDTFRRTAEAVGLPLADGSARTLLRRLRLLGHVEISEDGKQWFVTPTTVVESDDGSGCFLAGARDTTSIEALEAEGFAAGYRVRRERHETRDAPSIVRVSGAQPSKIVEVISRYFPEAASAGRAGLRLTEALPPIDQAHLLLSRTNLINLHSFDLEQYESKTNGYKAVSHPSTTGLYRLRSNDTCKLADRTLLYRADEQAWYLGDWYGLRFLARVAAGDRCTAAYDENRNLLAIPSDWHLPELYERALVLASGTLPKHVDGLHLYAGISRETADLMSQKLYASIEVKSCA